MREPALLSVRVARKSFGETEILRDVAFAIAPGEIVALLGPSGAGKSTLLRIVAGLDRRFDGVVETRARLAMAFQEPALLPWRTAERNIALAANVSAGAARAALEEVGLAPQADMYPRALSLGQQRRVSLARAFAVAPDLLLLDEAFVSLDGPTAARMRALTLEMLTRRGGAALLVTHDVIEAAQMADRVLALVGAPARIGAEIRLATARAARDSEWIAREAAVLRTKIDA